MPPKNSRCPYCFKALPSQNAVRLHVSASLSCNETWKKQFGQKSTKPARHLPSSLKTHDDSSPWSFSNSPTDDEMEIIADHFYLPSTPNNPPEAIDEVVTGPNNLEVEVRGLRFSEQYPRSIANPTGFQKTRFEKQHEEEETNGREPWEPYSSKDEWELARWLINNVNQKGTDKYLKLPIVSCMIFQLE
jgi:hypothetical protein